MGCFAYTCSVSNLSIEGGTPIRYFALVKSPFHEDWGIASPGSWHPLTVPLKGKYDEYGGVENIESGKVETEFFRLLSKDVIEVGVGDNSCHDVAVRKDMSQDEWFTALWEGRVKIRHPELVEAEEIQEKIKDLPKLVAKAKKLLGEDSPEPEPEPPKDAWRPTLQRVEAAIVAEGHKLEDFHVDELSNGHVRVRMSGYSSEYEELQILKLSEYATVLTASTGADAGEGELLVVPKPGHRLHTRSWLAKDNQIRQVVQAMVREDVWQYLLKFETTEYDGMYNLNYFQKKIRKSRVPSDADLIEKYRAEKDRRRLLEYVQWGTEIVEDGYVEAVAELAQVNFALCRLRCPWRAGHTWGPQFGEFEDHRDFHEAMARIADASKYEEDE